MKSLTTKFPYIKLVELELKHAKGFSKHGDNPDLWKYLPNENLDTIDKAQRFIKNVKSIKNSIAYAVIDERANEAIGSYMLLDLDKKNRSLEIGYVWLSSNYRGTGVNTVICLALFDLAFSYYNCIRVVWKTDERNIISQKVITKFGGTKEGIFRKHYIYPDGFIRNTVYYSVIDEEWPGVKKRMEALLENKYK